MEIGEFWTKVTALVNLYDGRVTSGPRSRKQNAAVGGVIDSMHQVGLAADVVLANWADTVQFTQLAKRMGITVIDELAEANHLHLQPANT